MRKRGWALAALIFSSAFGAATAGCNEQEAYKAKDVTVQVFPQVKTKPKDLVSINGLNADVAYTDVLSYVKYHRQEVDYSKIWPSDIPVMILGEKHTNRSPKDELISMLPDFKKMGMTHLALEVFYDIEQPIIDKFYDGKVKRGKLESLLSRVTLGDIKQDVSMVVVANKNGIKTLGIDLDLGGSITGWMVFSTLETRNRNWTDIIIKTLEENPRARIAVYAGADHNGFGLSLGATVNEMLLEEGIKSVNVDYVGCEIYNLDEKEGEYINFLRDIFDEIAKSAKQLGIDKQKFMIPLDSSVKPRDADYIIHLPQKEICPFLENCHYGE
ncbi:MAG: hypothetical protein ABIB71_09400 [Candidatus Woesearchaeota archaeon]